MAIQRYSDSFGDMMPQSFSSMLDRFFNDSLNSRGRMSSFAPHVDAYETERSYEIEAALPGMKREDIKVEFQQGRLTISGERHLKNERTDRRYHLMESQYGSFQHSFQLPDVANAQGIEAHFEDGMLRISVPKNEQKTMRHQIQIQDRQQQQSGMQSGQMSERISQQATDVRVDSGAEPNHAATPDQRSGAYQGNRISVDAASPVSAQAKPALGSQSGSTSWIDAGFGGDSYGDGHPDDGAGSMRGSGVGS
jgi:HSP20 family protein